MSVVSEDRVQAATSPLPAVSAWRWVHIAVAALAMVATLPGRTHGLGLFTEPIRRTFGLDTESYGFLNMWATVLGALFCLPCGWLLDRLGTRGVLAGVMLALGAVVLVMSQVQGDWVWHLTVPGGSFSVVLLGDLFLLVLLTRGLGQSALSVASLSLIGRTASRGTGLSMGVYAVLTSAGFIGAFAVLGALVRQHPNEWRGLWAGIGAAVIAAAVLSALLVRNRLLAANPADHGREVAGEPAESSLTLRQALRSPAFWTFGVAVSFFGMVSAGTSLFNESILNDLLRRELERQALPATAASTVGVVGSPTAPAPLLAASALVSARADSEIKRIFVNVTLLGIPIGLASNLLGGLLATRWSLSRLLALAMAGLAAALCAFPWIQTETQVYLYAALVAASGGTITVCFFAVWRVGFGPAHLGKIQGAAQMLTVLFSAFGPLLFGSVRTRLGSYLPLFPYLAAVSLALGLATWWAGLPRRGPADRLAAERSQGTA
jgi:MFS family permease